MHAKAPGRLATLFAGACHLDDPHTGAVVPPIEPATTYARDANYSLRREGISYSRDANPGYLPAETVLREAEGGAAALLFASGMAAATAVFQSLSPGAHVVVPRIMYHGLRDWLKDFCPRFGIGIDSFDPADPDGIERAIRKGKTRLVWIETPANPTWDVTDIAAAAEIAHSAGARLAVDSTVATPILTRPIEHGADVVMHSATKYLNGHSDVVAGALVFKQMDADYEAARFQRLHGGAVLGPFEAWLLLRGMRTLQLRVARACESALRIAAHFEHHPAIEQARYPGLESHPGHAVAGRQMSGGYGGMLSLLVKGDQSAARIVAMRTRVFRTATSLGGVESLIEHRATVEGPNSPIPANLLRLSVGIEAVEDLIQDLEQALD
ncbi:MAG TPA: aminotransferase class I/II-fold pyridoxal phosphate-dependent enzyme [Gammaproteobacteria bacterium]|nr:aminotransferase class I/II-fold pyridoxal phosphate-dependent enzyme [Gammaproteobacteria bacterium]